MSKEITTITNTGKQHDRTLSLSQSCGPDGPILQLTQGFANYLHDLDEPGFVQLTVTDAYHLTIALANWLKTVTHDRAETLQAEINRNQELQKTIFQDAVNCQRFIDDLQILRIPVRLLS